MLKFGLKVSAIFILIPLLCVCGALSYWWLTYLDEDVIAGHAYGFTIGNSKTNTFADLQALKVEYPGTHVYVSYGDRAGDRFSVPVTLNSQTQIFEYDKWAVLLDGQYEFLNSIDLKFENDTLTKIHRHRQKFELP